MSCSKRCVRKQAQDLQLFARRSLTVAAANFCAQVLRQVQQQTHGMRGIRRSQQERELRCDELSLEWGGARAVELSQLFSCVLILPQRHQAANAQERYLRTHWFCCLAQQSQSRLRPALLQEPPGHCNFVGRGLRRRSRQFDRMSKEGLCFWVGSAGKAPTEDVVKRPAQAKHCTVGRCEVGNRRCCCCCACCYCCRWRRRCCSCLLNRAARRRQRHDQRGHHGDGGVGRCCRELTWDFVQQIGRQVSAHRRRRSCRQDKAGIRLLRPAVKAVPGPRAACTDRGQWRHQGRRLDRGRQHRSRARPLQVSHNSCNWNLRMNDLATILLPL
mmetsp:Transcript_64011/g.172022  ORF Transcript_64011/g.172022 Transcript_64011/m.172022 type:complete len:329 (-) Transcript_64011:138-1124(-)